MNNEENNMGVENYPHKVRYYEGIHDHFLIPPVPENWLVFNTTRPLRGSINPEIAEQIKAMGGSYDAPILGHDRVAVTWNARGRIGWFFAAIDPADPDLEQLVEFNRTNDGHLCIWVTKQEVVDFIQSYYAKMYPDLDFEDLEKEFPYEEMVRSYENIQRDIDKKARGY